MPGGLKTVSQAPSPSQSAEVKRSKSAGSRNVTRGAAERWLLGGLLGLAAALVLSGIANIALARDAGCREDARAARWGQEFSPCFSDVTRWEVEAVARGPAAVGEPGEGSITSWLAIPLVYITIGGVLAQLSLRNAIVGGLIVQLALFGVLAAMAFFSVYVG